MNGATGLGSSASTLRFRSILNLTDVVRAAHGCSSHRRASVHPTLRLALALLLLLLLRARDPMAHHRSAALTRMTMSTLAVRTVPAMVMVMVSMMLQSGLPVVTTRR